MDNLKEENVSENQSKESSSKRTERPPAERKRKMTPKRKTIHHRPKVKYIKPKKGNRIALSLASTFLVVGISVLLSISIIFLTKELFGIDKSAASYTVKVPENATIDDIVKLITEDQEKKKKEPIIKVEKMFRMLAEFKQSRDPEFEFVAGEHTLSPNMGYSDIISELTSYNYIERETVKITIPEGKNIREVAQLLEENKVCAADLFVYYFNKGLQYDFINNIPSSVDSVLRFDRMEGYLFPDTYEFYKAPYEDVTYLEEKDYEIILRKIYDNFEEKYTPEFAQRAKDIGMTMDNVITLASIVQCEAGNVPDMKKIASVFHNRLDDPLTFPRLESDPTSAYSEYVVRKFNESSNENMVDAYNTYTSSGLPPGPICSPGIDAIKAVLWPDETKLYYFCANIETREVYFAETYEQHKENCIAAGIQEY